MTSEVLDPNPGPWERLARRAESFGNGEWVLVGLVANIGILLLAQVFLWLLPDEKLKAPEIATATELSFVEYEEVRQTEPVKSRDFSDKIVEKDKLDKEEEINWANAADPTFDMNQRYRPIFSWPDDKDNYPDRARRSSLPTVTVNFTMLVGSDGRIRDVRIIGMRSDGDAHKAYEADFRQAVRDIVLKRTRLTSRPYTVGGVATEFRWTASIRFKLR